MRSFALTASAIFVLLLSTQVGAESEAEPMEDDPLAELAALGDAIADVGPEAGGSIRAKRMIDPALLQRQKDPNNLQARVETVRVGRFPAVALKVKVSRPAKEGPGKQIARNDSLVLLPKLKVKGGRVALDDPDTLRNAGAFYFKPGDKIYVRLGAKQKGTVWEAEYIERK